MITMKKQIHNLSRRRFLKDSAVLTGSGLVLGVFGGSVSMAEALAKGTVPESTFAPNVFVSINEAGDVAIVASRSEMGQGVRTGLPAVLADELEADWDRVTIVQATGDEKFGNQNTDGSRSIRNFYMPMRQAGATAREMLVAAAAQTWGVPASECKAQNHTVIHESSNRSLGYGELASVAASVPVPENPTLKTKDQFRYIGTPVSGVDNKDIVQGKALYGIDAAMPGMVYASIERSPVLRGSVQSYDDTETLKVPGVQQVVPLDPSPDPPAFHSWGGLAVIASNTWAAQQGRSKLQVEWNDGENAVFDSETYRTQLEEAVHVPGTIAREEGTVDPAFEGAATVLEADYYVPLLAHATMEPPSCLASFKDGTCEVWAPVQSPQTARGVVAQALSIDPSNVTMNVTLLGGGFGRKSKPDFVVEAALLSKAVGAPVHLTWTREDEIRHGYYHSVSAQYLKAAVDENGMPTAWLQRSAFPSISSTFAPNVTRAGTGELGLGLLTMPYQVPNIRLENGEARAHVRIGWLRSVSNIYHAFAINGFADELAAAAGRDPKDYLLDLIGEPRNLDIFNGGQSTYGVDTSVYVYDTGRLRNVVEVAAREAGWGRSLPEGHGLGIAAHYSFVTYVAQVVEASVDDQGKVTVHRVDCVVDCGTIVNPDRVRAQMEGAVIFGLSLALHGKITAKGGRIEQSNFHDYPVLRINETPEIHVHLVESDELPTGIGEPGVPPLAPALANAIFAATGQRIRELPIQLG